MNITIKIEISEKIKKLSQLVQIGLQRGVTKSTAYVTQQVVSNAPRITGNLKRSIHSEVTSLGSSLSGKIIQDSGIASYGRYVEEGTGLYGPYHKVIRPKNGKVLSWKINGVKIYASYIKGMTGRLYMRRAFDESKDTVKEIIAEEILKEINVGG